MALPGATHQAFLVVVTSLVLATVKGQTVTINPSNVGALRGEQNVVLGCNVTDLPQGNYIEWQYYPSWQTTEFLIYTTYDNVTNDPTNFTVTRTIQGDATQSVDLVVKTAKPDLATQYKCDLTPIKDKGQQAYLIVLDDLECPTSNVEYAEGDEANLTCGVNVFKHVQSGFPILNWYKSDDQYPISGGVLTIESNTRITLSLTKNLTSADDNQEFTCLLTFPYSNPSYTDNCSTILFVRHEVSQVKFYPPSSVESPTEVPVGQSINCSANGRPAPKITWYDDKWNVLAETSELFVMEDMRYWQQPVTLFCKANNTINGGAQYAEATGNYTFIVIASEIVVQSAGTEAWVIAVVVIVSILALAGIGIAIFFIVRHYRGKKKKSKAKPPTNGSTSARPTTTTTTATTYSAVPSNDFTSASRPPPTSAPRTTGSISSNRGPPGPDSRNGAAGGGDSPGYGDLGVQPYGGSNQAVNTYPTRSSVHGSSQALGVGVSMNPNPGYMARGSNPALNTSITTNPRPNYPYSGSNSALNTSLSMNPNPAAAVGANYGRQPSIASSSGRSHASSYNAAIPAMEMNRYPNDLSSMHGSEV